MDVFDLIDDYGIEEDNLILNYINPDKKQRVVRVRSDDINKWNDIEFHRRFRLKKETVQFILSLIDDKISHVTNR